MITATESTAVQETREMHEMPEMRALYELLAGEVRDAAAFEDWYAERIAAGESDATLVASLRAEAAAHGCLPPVSSAA